jgi:RNA polymerase sigma-70 factor (ECF subfamily)
MTPNEDRAVVLLLAHRAMLIGYITSIVRDAHLAEDVFQNMALVVLKKGHQVRDEKGFPAWARKIARFEALNAVRKRRHTPELLDLAVLEMLEDHWQSSDADPAAVNKALCDCIERLSPHARQLIQLRYVEDLGAKAVAERLARPLNTVYVALSRTYRLLATCVQQRLAREGVACG